MLRPTLRRAAGRADVFTVFYTYSGDYASWRLGGHELQGELQGSGVRGQETSAAVGGDVVLEGGVAGGIPPHKGGPKARPPKLALALAAPAERRPPALSRLSGEGCAGTP